MVHMFSAQAQPTSRSASVISSAASGLAKPPEMPSAHGFPVNSPLATAEVANNAPHRSASRSSSTRACRAPRPATNTGRRARAIAEANSATADGSGAGGGYSGSAPGDSAGVDSACTSSGRLSSTVRRSWVARRTARTTSATAEAADTRSATAPTETASASWSIWKFERGEVASAASTTSGVRLLAASVMPVSALVSPQPWCTDSTPSRPLVRA